MPLHAAGQPASKTSTKPESIGKQDLANSPFQFEDNRPETAMQLKFGYIANGDPVQKKENKTGLPDALKSGVESLSGYSLDDVKVHYNSGRPAQLQAHAFAQGTDIHIAPGQEKHLPHEAWHVVQQKQGRVKPTMQMKAGVNVNDDSGLEREADVMGKKALQLKESESLKTVAAKSANTGSGIVQLFRLKIGISGDQNPLNIDPDQLPPLTYVWILSNSKDKPDSLDQSGVSPGHNKSSPDQIIAANANGVQTPIYTKVGGYQRGYPMKGIFQSGVFKVPRGGDTSGIDYSFLRFAAIESYKLWFAAKGKSELWPDISSDGTHVETIDSDFSGITSDSGKALNENKKEEGSWLAEAGVYKWDWRDVKDDGEVIKRFSKENILDSDKRDAALKKFADAYFEIEVSKRDEAAADILQIYFPEPATRLSSYAIDLISQSGFQNMKVTRGNQLGFGRESIGLIAGLVHLDKKKTGKAESRSIAKLKYNRSYVVPTDLGKRKGAFVTLFLNWCIQTQNGESELSASAFEGLSGISQFDQSYLNPGLPGQVKGWHLKTIGEMNKPGDAAANAFFHPE
jgi:hypothetical protein